jgi:hypothetical protein
MVLNRAHDQFSFIVNAKLSHQIEFVCIHRFYAYTQNRRGCADRSSFSQKLKHFSFTGGENILL